MKKKISNSFNDTRNKKFDMDRRLNSEALEVLPSGPGYSLHGPGRGFADVEWSNS